ncbi:MAG: hypothetical protein KAR42_14750 [candidate division Zixibacteria bacterium]|nr:hypothetical protein [candidate division Zixibacteria bacterium]
MIQVTTTIDDGYTVYKFEANNTEYEVLTDDGKTYQVWSNRKGCAGRTPPTCYDSLSDMAKRSKALANLATLIEA